MVSDQEQNPPATEQQGADDKQAHNPIQQAIMLPSHYQTVWRAFFSYLAGLPIRGVWSDEATLNMICERGRFVFVGFVGVDPRTKEALNALHLYVRITNRRATTAAKLSTTTTVSNMMRSGEYIRWPGDRVDEDLRACIDVEIRKLAVDIKEAPITLAKLVRAARADVVADSRYDEVRRP